MKPKFLLPLFLLGQLLGSKNHVIDQKDKEFSQHAITVKAGESIEFINSDTVEHNVYSTTPLLKFDLKQQAPGEKTVIQFPKPGIVEVKCSIHPKMKLMVTVKP